MVVNIRELYKKIKELYEATETYVCRKEECIVQLLNIQQSNGYDMIIRYLKSNGEEIERTYYKEGVREQDLLRKKEAGQVINIRVTMEVLQKIKDYIKRCTVDQAYNVEIRIQDNKIIDEHKEILTVIGMQGVLRILQVKVRGMRMKNTEQGTIIKRAIVHLCEMQKLQQIISETSDVWLMQKSFSKVLSMQISKGKVYITNGHYMVLYDISKLIRTPEVRAYIQEKVINIPGIVLMLMQGAVHGEQAVITYTLKEKEQLQIIVQILGSVEHSEIQMEYNIDMTQIGYMDVIGACAKQLKAEQRYRQEMTKVELHRIVRQGLQKRVRIDATMVSIWEGNKVTLRIPSVIKNGMNIVESAITHEELEMAYELPRRWIKKIYLQKAERILSIYAGEIGARLQMSTVSKEDTMGAIQIQSKDGELTIIILPLRIQNIEW
jgi:hypothetical protein